MHVVIFEGNQWRTFAPFSLSRPVFLLASGIGTLLDKQIRATRPTRLTLWVRPEFATYCHRFVVPNLPCPADVNVPLGEEPALLLSGRTLHLSDFDHWTDHPNVVIDDEPSGPVVRQAFAHSPGLAPADVFDRTDAWLKLHDLPHATQQSRLPTYVWDLIRWNEEAIVADAVHCCGDAVHPKPAGPYHLVHDDNVWLGKGVTLGPGCVLDADRGPVVLGDGVTIGANAVLAGPCYVGPHSTISPLAFLRGGTSIGPMCKVGGEVSNSIVLGHANKAHDGFLGDSYLGEWVNLGAGTTTSNLKNTYGEITMPVDGRPVATGRRFLGSLIGDHTKTAIGTRLTTGTYVGYNCSVATSGPVPRLIPSFTFLTDRGPEPYAMDKAAEVQRQVFARRNRPWTADDDAMNDYVAATAAAMEHL